MQNVHPMFANILTAVAPREVEEECDHDWRVEDDSYDDHFGTVRIPKYLRCNCCGETADMPGPEY